MMYMDLQRVHTILNNKEKSDVFYDERPVWIQGVDEKRDIAKVGFVDNFEAVSYTHLKELQILMISKLKKMTEKLYYRYLIEGCPQPVSYTHLSLLFFFLSLEISSLVFICSCSIFATLLFV